MKKYILTKDFLEIAETYGIFQNLSGDANIEITDNTKEQGILLKPFQKVTINQQVYARKLTGGGTAQLIVLPFKTDSDSEIDSAEETDSDNYYYSEDYLDKAFNRPRKNKNRRNDYGFSYDWQRPREQPPQIPPIPPMPPPPMFPPDTNPAVVDCDGFYMLRIPKDSLNGQNKFLVQINNVKGD